MVRQIETKAASTPQGGLWSGPVVVLLALVMAGQGMAAGFDCAKARSAVERLICADPGLSAQDAELLRVYRQALQQAGVEPVARRLLVQDEDRWLRQVRNACGDRNCLAAAYGARITELRAEVAGPPVQPPAGKVPPPAPASRPPASSSAAPPPPVQPPLHTLILRARGEQHVEFELGRFGRHAVTVTSHQGTALQLIDRVAGPQPLEGQAGLMDGRWDGLLDRGRYRLRLLGAEQAEGEARVVVHGFIELSAPAPLLPELRPVTTELGDFSQRSWWLQVTQTRPLVLEAAGRYLADLRLWRDGTWLVAATPVVTRREPRPGQPLVVCRLVARVEPGLYLLTAYGGLGHPWSVQSAERPLYLRSGIPELAEAGRQQLTLGASGLDRWQVPRAADQFRLELPAAPLDGGRVQLRVAPYDPAAPAFAGGLTAALDKQSRLPVAELRQTTNGPYNLVEIEGPAGQPYTLQQLPRRPWQRLQPGDYWLDTLHAGATVDRIDATALLVRNDPDQARMVADRAILLDARHAWQRRCNLTAPATLFLQVARAGAYRIQAQGVEARFRIEPFLTSRPAGYQVPPSYPAGHQWMLESGYYVLSLQPQQRGIVEVSLGAVAAAGASMVLAPPQASARFGALHLGGDRPYTLYLNEIPETAGTPLVRPLPVDLGRALPMTLQAGEEVVLPIRLPEAGRLTARREDGSAAELRVDWGGWGRAATLAAGGYTVHLRAPGDAPEALTLSLAPTRLDPAIPLPPLPNTALAAPPPFPELLAGQPQFFDLTRGARRTFALRVDSPALYRLETSGLLHTAGQLRTRTAPALAQGDGNGAGRNLLIQQFLGQGDYQLSVAAMGDSQGHAGVRLSATELLDGGRLVPGTPARATLPAGQGLALHLPIERAGDYRLRTLGLGRVLDLRLEDAQGWPLVEPGQPGDLTLRLAPGDYRLIVLPGAVQARVLALLDPVPETPHFAGHGPHPLPFATQMEHLWEEPDHAGQPRTPDQWDFTLPASARMTLALDNDMRGELRPLGDADRAAPLAQVAAGRGWQGELPAGRYRLALTQRRSNNRVYYHLSLTPTELVAGESREVSAPQRIPLSLGAGGLTEIYSVGDADVRARLYDAAGRLVAHNDDREDDWNFQLALRAPAGRYELEVQPVGQNEAQTRVYLRSTPERDAGPLTLPAHWQIQEEAVQFYPLVLPAGSNLLVVAGRAAEPLGLALERQGPTGWELLGSRTGRSAHLELPVQAQARYRLRVWRPDRRGSPLLLEAAAATVTPVSEAQLAAGVPGTRLAGCRVAAVTLARPGLFLRAGPLPVRTAGPGEVLESPAGDLLYGLASPLWLAADAATAAPFQGRRLEAAADAKAALALTIPAGRRLRVDIAPGGGPLLLHAQARNGQPGIRVVEDRSSALDVATGEAVTVALDTPRPTAELWNAGAPDEPLQARLRILLFPRSSVMGMQPPMRQRHDSQTQPWGVTQGTLEAGAALQLRLPPGDKALQLTLPPSTAAVLNAADGSPELHWSGEEGAAETLETRSGRLLLLHAGGVPAAYALGLAPGRPGESVPRLGMGRLWQRACPAAGVLRLPVAAGARVHLEGVEQAQFLGADGRVQSGTDLAVGVSGTLILRHGPGVVVAWAERTPEWVPAATPTTLPVPGRMTLAGTQQSLRFTAARPVLLRLRTETPVIARWATLEREHVKVYPYGALLDLYTPAGATLVTLYPLGGGSLGGELHSSATPVDEIDEGIGPQRLLAAGEARAFAFRLARSAQVGLGLRADSGLVEGRLLDGWGGDLGVGVVHYRALPAGTYLLLAQAPATGAPVQVQPVVLGLRGGDQGPSPELIHRFMTAGPGAGPISDTPPPAATESAAGDAAEGEAEEGTPTQVEAQAPG